MEFIEFPDEIASISLWKWRQLSDLICTRLGCSENSVKRDLADAKAMLESGEIVAEDCPVLTGSKRNFWLRVEAVRFLWYYRQIVQTYGYRAVAKEYIKKNGVPLWVMYSNANV